MKYTETHRFFPTIHKGPSSHIPVRHAPTYLVLVHQTRVSTKIQVSAQVTERADDVLQNEAHARVAILALCRELPHTDLSECLLPKSFYLRNVTSHG